MIIGLHIFYHLLLHRMSPTRNSTSTRKNAMILTQPKIGFDMIIGLHIFYHLLPHRMPPTRNSTSTRKNDHRDSKSIKTLQAERAIIRSNEEAPCRSKISHDNLKYHLISGLIQTFTRENLPSVVGKSWIPIN